jgi:hypothetical protein
MNYNIIYDSKNKTYYDSNSKEGLVLIDTLYSFIEKNQEKKQKKGLHIDKLYFTQKTYRLSLLSLGLMKCRLFNYKQIDKKKCEQKDYANIFLSILSLFTQDELYKTINLYEYIYIIYKIKKNIYKRYKLITLQSEEINDEIHNEINDEIHNEINEINEEDTFDNPLENIVNIDMLVSTYNKLYTHTHSIIRFILNPKHAFILYNIHYLLDIDLYTQTLHHCVNKTFIKNIQFDI